MAPVTTIKAEETRPADGPDATRFAIQARNAPARSRMAENRAARWGGVAKRSRSAGNRFITQTVPATALGTLAFGSALVDFMARPITSLYTVTEQGVRWMTGMDAPDWVGSEASRQRLEILQGTALMAVFAGLLAYGTQQGAWMAHVTGLFGVALTGIFTTGRAAYIAFQELGYVPGDEPRRDVPDTAIYKVPLHGSHRKKYAILSPLTTMLKRKAAEAICASRHPLSPEEKRIPCNNAGRGWSGRIGHPPRPER